MIFKTKEEGLAWARDRRAQGHWVKVRRISFVDLARAVVWYGDDLGPDLKRIRARLEKIRAEIRAERVSYGELAELQGLKRFIDPGDVELLKAAGIPEK